MCQWIELIEPNEAWNKWSQGGNPLCLSKLKFRVSLCVLLTYIPIRSGCSNKIAIHVAVMVPWNILVLKHLVLGAPRGVISSCCLSHKNGCMGNCSSGMHKCGTYCMSWWSSPWWRMYIKRMCLSLHECDTAMSVVVGGASACMPQGYSLEMHDDTCHLTCMHGYMHDVHTC